MEFITNNLKEVIIAIIAIFVGIVITIKIKNNSNKVTQKDNEVGGDMAGRDIKK